MFQNFVADHISRSTAVTALSFSDNVGYVVKMAKASAAYENRAADRINGTSTNANLGIGIPVHDPELRGPMVLSWRFAVYGTANSPVFALPGVFDYQQNGNLGAAAQFTLGSVTDMQLEYPPVDLYVVNRIAGGRVAVAGQGRMLVNTNIETATSGVDARDFGIGVIVQHTAGDYDLHVSLQARLHANDYHVHQPRK